MKDDFEEYEKTSFGNVKNFESDLIICSKSKRTILIYEWLAKKFEKIKKIEINFSQEIYDYHLSDSEKFIDLIEKVDDKIDKLAIIWHNPLFDEIIEKLINISWIHIPTLWIVEIKFKIDSWWKIRDKWELRLFLTPFKK